MAYETIFDDKSLLQVGTDPIASSDGNVTVEGNKINLGANSSISYHYEYGVTGTLVKTTQLQFDIRASISNKQLETRYNNLFYLLVKIRYWQEDEASATGWSAGPWSVCRIYPYFDNERDGYNRYIVLNVETQYINTFEVYFITENIEDATLTLNNPLIHTALNLSDIIGSGGGGGGKVDQLLSIDTYDDGMVAYYTGDENPVTIYVEEKVEDTTFLVNVSGRYDFNIVIHKGTMPWER